MAAESSLAGDECSHPEVSVWDLFAARDVRRPSIFRTRHRPDITRTCLLYIQLLREVLMSYLFLWRSTFTGLVHSLDAEQLRVVHILEASARLGSGSYQRARPLKRA